MRSNFVVISTKRTNFMSYQHTPTCCGSAIPLVFAACSFYFAFASESQAQTTNIPHGASTLHYTKCVIDEHPTAADIAPDKNGSYKWFSGHWSIKVPATPDHYQTVNGALVISLGGEIAGVPRDFSAGLLPLLSGANGFYVEFDVQLSDNDPDHFPAVWLMPAEHNGKKVDHYQGDPDGFERWLELDVDEGGLGRGMTGTVHSWSGIYPAYKSEQNPNNHSPVMLIRNHKHTFGASYDPTHQQVTWWLDGARQWFAKAPYVPDVASRQSYYLIISAQTHGAQKPYTMTITGVRAYVPPSSPLPAKQP